MTHIIKIWHRSAIGVTRLAYVGTLECAAHRMNLQEKDMLAAAIAQTQLKPVYGGAFGRSVSYHATLDGVMTNVE